MEDEEKEKEKDGGLRTRTFQGAGEGRRIDDEELSSRRMEE